jgi:UDP-N-acetyl-D-mannosaminuronate dehydrogenase
MNKQTIGILGHGEIGSSLEKCYLGRDFTVKIKDLLHDDGLENLDVLNVCIPYTKDFVKIVSENIFYTKAKLTIIHSTVIPGTTKEIQTLMSSSQHVVHSPVRGVHPKLYEGLKTFVKYIGADSEEAAKLTENHFEALGLKYETLPTSTTSELAKILCTTYYGVCIAWHNDIQKLCEKYNVSFNDVGTKWNTTYNEGYVKLGMSNVVRPVLYPPQGKIGGHCVVPNTELLKQIHDSLGFDYILQLK